MSLKFLKTYVDYHFPMFHSTKTLQMQVLLSFSKVFIFFEILRDNNMACVVDCMTWHVCGMFG